MLVYLKLLDTPEEKEVFRMLYEQYAQNNVSCRLPDHGEMVLWRKIWFMRLS